MGSFLMWEEYFLACLLKKYSYELRVNVLLHVQAPHRVGCVLLILRRFFFCFGRQPELKFLVGVVGNGWRSIPDDPINVIQIITHSIPLTYALGIAVGSHAA